MSASIALQPQTAAAATSGTSAAATSATTAAQPAALSTMDIWSIIITFASAVAMGIVAYISAGKGWWIGIAAAMGALGGLVHEIAQSGGKILLFERKADGFYLGSVAGSVLGAVAGLMTIRGLLIAGGTPDGGATQLVYEALFAGLAMKGVTEAAGGQAMPEGSKSLTAGEAIALEATANAMASDNAANPVIPARRPRQALGPLPDALPADL